MSHPHLGPKSALPRPCNAKQGAPALSYSYSYEERARGSKANEVRGAIGSLLFYRACACVDIRIFTARLGQSLTPHNVKEGEVFLPFPVFGES